jgi:aerobic C4-dicarboxylate transport protein
MPHVPIAGVALLVGIDRFMSEARALTSFIGNAVASVVIARWEGACDTAVMRTVLADPQSQTPPAAVAAKNRVRA